MRFNDQSPVTFNDPLPEKTAVIVIGGGIAGVATAWFLAKAGVPVLLCEKGRIAGEQSSRNWGWVRQTGRDEAELPIMMESIDLWAGLGAEIGEDVGFQRGGCLFLAETAAQAAEFDDFMPLAKARGLATTVLTGKQVDEKLDSRPGQWAAAMYTPSDGRAEPFLAVPALARAAQRKGVLLRENCAVRGLLREGGKVAGVVTEHGTIRCSTVLCAAGAWSTLLLANEGIHLPQLRVRNTVARTSPGPEVFSGAACADDLAFRRRQDGGYTLALCDELEHFVGRDSFRFAVPFLPALRKSWDHMQVRFAGGPPGAWESARWQLDQETPFERQRVLDPEPSEQSVTRMRQLLAERLPRLKDLTITESWAGMIDATPDAIPVMDCASSIEGLWIATGFSGHGFGFGMGAGRVMADLIQGNEPRHDMQRFRLSRFSDGSPLELGPWI